MNENLAGMIRILRREAVIHRTFVVFSFAVIVIGFLVAGVLWPKSYSSYTTVFVEEDNILGPLMEGAAVQTEVTDRARIAREVIYGRALLTKVLKEQWDTQGLSPRALEQMLSDMKDRTQITNVGKNLIRIEYRDRDPQRTHLVTKRLAELFIKESLSAKQRESESAFAFIDQQVKEYAKKLDAAEKRLERFRGSNADARPGAETAVDQRLSELRSNKDKLQQELREARIKKKSLEAQLSGEQEAAALLTRSEQYRARIAELEKKLDELRLSYHESYPDIVHLKDQIRELRTAADKQEAREEAAKRRAARTGQAAVDESVQGNPVYQKLRAELYQTNTTIHTLQSRLDHAGQLIDQELDRSRRIQKNEATLAQLTRDYEVNRDTYQDLLRRRESARVSMNLDREEQGLTLRIDEPAYLPHQPSGLRLAHFVLAGLVLGVVFPLGALYTRHQLDHRIASPAAITERFDIVLAGAVPERLTHGQLRRQALWGGVLTLTVISTLGAVIAVVALRLKGMV